MNRNLKSAIIGGGSIASILLTGLLMVWVVASVVFGVVGAQGEGLFFGMVAGALLLSATSLVSWIAALIDASTNRTINDENRALWIIAIAMLGIWAIPFYWYKHVRV